MRFKLNNNKDFISLYKKGRYIAGRDCVVYFRKNGRGCNRVGISTGKKIGNAVSRSRARRVIRAAYAAAERDFPVGFDMVITARTSCTACKSFHVEKFFKNRVIPFMKKPPETKGGKMRKNQ